MGLNFILTSRFSLPNSDFRPGPSQPLRGSRRPPLALGLGRLVLITAVHLPLTLVHEEPDGGRSKGLELVLDKLILPIEHVLQLQLEDLEGFGAEPAEDVVQGLHAEVVILHELLEPLLQFRPPSRSPNGKKHKIKAKFN